MGMGIFTTNHADAGGFEPIKPGTYEAVITEVEVKRFNTGSSGLKATLTIRDDIDQPFKKRKIFDNLIQTEKAMFKFQQYAKAIGMPEGVEVETLEQFAGQMKFKAVRVKVSNRTYTTDSGEEKIQDDVEFVDVATASYGGQAASADPFNIPGAGPGVQADSGGAKPPWEDDGKPIDISEDDLPF